MEQWEASDQSALRHNTQTDPEGDRDKSGRCSHLTGHGIRAALNMSFCNEMRTINHAVMGLQEAVSRARPRGTPWRVQTNRGLTRAACSREIEGARRSIEDHEVEFTDMASKNSQGTPVQGRVTRDGDVADSGGHFSTSDE